MVIWLFMTWLHVISSVVWNNFIDPLIDPPHYLIVTGLAIQ